MAFLGKRLGKKIGKAIKTGGPGSKSKLPGKVMRTSGPGTKSKAPTVKSANRRMSELGGAFGRKRLK